MLQRERSLHVRKRCQAGFTLVELLVVVAVAAILLAIGVPAMQSLISSNQLTSLADDFASALNMARSEAGKRGTRVKVASTSGSVDWGTNGWTMNVINPDGSLGALLRQGAPVPAAYTLYSTSNFSPSLSFDSTGRLYGGGTGEFVICRTSGGEARMITLAASGRVRVAPNNNLGQPIDDGGTAVTTCTP